MNLNSSMYEKLVIIFVPSLDPILSDLVNQMSSTYNLSLKVAYSASRGFHIQLYNGPSDGFTADNLPAVFIKVTKSKNTFSFTTSDLVS